jgi:hypothetical protein
METLERDVSRLSTFSPIVFNEGSWWFNFYFADDLTYLCVFGIRFVQHYGEPS